MARSPSPAPRAPVRDPAQPSPEPRLAPESSAPRPAHPLEALCAASLALSYKARCPRGPDGREAASTSPHSHPYPPTAERQPDKPDRGNRGGRRAGVRLPALRAALRARHRRAAGAGDPMPGPGRGPPPPLRPVSAQLGQVEGTRGQRLPGQLSRLSTRRPWPHHASSPLPPQLCEKLPPPR